MAKETNDSSDNIGTVKIDLLIFSRSLLNTIALLPFYFVVLCLLLELRRIEEDDCLLLWWLTGLMKQSLTEPHAHHGRKAYRTEISIRSEGASGLEGCQRQLLDP